MPIPTKSKFPLSGRLSYPVGAEAISRVLAEAPHVDELRLTFYNRGFTSESDWQRALRQGKPYPILTISYLPSSKPGFIGSRSMIEDGWYDEQWKIWVRPVLREHRHLANRLLLETGLPAVARWLRSSSRPGWEMVYRALELIFEPNQEPLAIVQYPSE